DAVVAEVWREPKAFVRFDGIYSLILKLVGLELVDETDAAALLIEVYDHALSLFGDHFHRRLELPAAIGAEGMEDIASETFRVHSAQDAGVRSDVPQNECDVLMLIVIVAVTHDPPGPVFSRQASFGDAMHKPLGLETMRYELGDSDEGKAVLLCETLELGSPSTRAIFAENLTNHSGWYEAGKASEINGRLGVPHALKHSSLACAKRRHVTRTAQIGRNSLGIDRDTNGFGAILRTHSSGNTKALVRIDTDGESSTVLVGVDLALLSELELVGAFPRQRETNPSACLADHEVDHLGGDKVRRADYIAFVLALLIVGDDYQLAGLDVGYCLFDSSELHDSSSARAKNRSVNLASLLRAGRAPGVDAHV